MDSILRTTVNNDVYALHNLPGDPMTRMTKTLFALLSGLFMAYASPVMAQAFPNKPIRIIVPFPPGGGNDVIARVVAQKLNERSICASFYGSCWYNRPMAGYQKRQRRTNE